MPSSGYGIVNLLENYTEEQWKKDGWSSEYEIYRVIKAEAQHAINYGMFIEWLSSFIACWETTKNPIIAARAGAEEWDL